jgi:hypothetical protein
MEAGDLWAADKEDGVDGDGQGASRVPRGHQWHLEVDPGLAKGDETNHHHASEGQCQAQLVGDLPGLM